MSKELKEYVQNIKTNAVCKDCVSLGRDGVWPPECFDFDHRSGEIKLGTIKELAGSGDLEKLQIEIAKCDLVCANCHRIRTKQRGLSLGGWINLKLKIKRGPSEKKKAAWKDPVIRERIVKAQSKAQRARRERERNKGV